MKKRTKIKDEITLKKAFHRPFKSHLNLASVNVMNGVDLLLIDTSRLAHKLLRRLVYGRQSSIGTHFSACLIGQRSIQQTYSLSLLGLGVIAALDQIHPRVVIVIDCF